MPLNSINLQQLIEYLIMFLSSKKINLLGTAFREVQNSDTVKRGEELLKELRRQSDYQLGLATFLTRSKDTNERLLAITELQKILVLKEEQSVWLLKQIYYKDVEKVSKNIKKVICYVKNIKLAGQFLEINFQQIGFVQSRRYLQFIFSILKSPERLQESLYFHFELLLQGLISNLEVISQSEQCLFMNIVCLAMFYQAALQKDFPANQQRLGLKFIKIKEKCKFYMTYSVSIVISIIDRMLGSQRLGLQRESISIVFAQTFKCLCGKQNQLTKYYARLMSFICKHLNIFSFIPTILDFISAFHQYNSDRLENMLIQSEFNAEIELNNVIEKELETDDQSLLRESLCFFIEEIFTKHYQQVTKQYCKTEKTTHPLFYFLIPLLNFYNSTRIKIIGQWISNNLQNAIDLLGKSINLLDVQQDKNLILKDCVMFTQFLVKFKSLLPIPLFVHVCHIMQQISAAKSALSPFCFNFIQHSLQYISYLNFEQLTNFLNQHLVKLNQNQWDHRLQNFSCFLRLSKCLQQQYLFYSHFLSNDCLVQESIKSCQIIVSLLQQIPQNKINYQLVILLIQLVSAFIKGIQPSNYSEFHSNLNVSFIRKVIQSSKIYSIESADIVILDLLVKNKLPINWFEYSRIELNDLRDHQFVISLFLKQANYIKEKLGIEAFHYQKMSLYRQLQFLFQSMDKEKVNQLKQSKLWPDIKSIRQQWNLPAISN